MKFCNKCNTEFADNMSFCTNCGNELVEKENSAPQPPIPPQQPKPKKKIAKILKRILLALAAIAVLGYMIYSHLQNSTTYLVLNSQGEVFSKQGDTKDINIDYDGYSWQITYKPNWVSITEFDDSFRLHCYENSDGEDRQDHITIKSGKIVQALPIAQLGKAQYITLSTTSVKCDKDGGYIDIEIETDGCGADIRYPKYCSIENHTVDGFTIWFSENEGTPRNGTIYVEEDNITRSISIKQEGKCYDCGGDGEKDCSYCGGLGQHISYEYGYGYGGGYGYHTRDCYYCGKDGKVRCGSCRGTGYKY